MASLSSHVVGSKTRGTGVYPAIPAHGDDVRSRGCTADDGRVVSNGLLRHRQGTSAAPRDAHITRAHCVNPRRAIGVTPPAMGDDTTGVMPGVPTTCVALFAKFPVSNDSFAFVLPSFLLGLS